LKAIGHSSMVISFLCAVSANAVSSPQVPADLRPEVKRHINDLIREVPANSALGRELASGAHGSGIHYLWMDDMRRENIKRAIVWIKIRFDRNGKPRQMRIERIEYFAKYENGARVLCNSVLDQKLSTDALQKAENGLWLDVPRPRPRPFVGAAAVEFFDDEWLPTLSAPFYCAGENCIADAIAK
jgi:hypothetical protein